MAAQSTFGWVFITVEHLSHYRYFLLVFIRSSNYATTYSVAKLSRYSNRYNYTKLHYLIERYIKINLEV
jgi:hypothetical protein